ncbi:MAG: L,D-transpeptidase [Thermomicrobiales bacterium]|nr:L,D-transpeptidase [Thermomicrobiales bacterium]
MLAFTAAAIFGTVTAPVLAQDQVATDSWTEPVADPQWSETSWDQQGDATWVDPNAVDTGEWVDPNAGAQGAWTDDGSWSQEAIPEGVGAWTEPELRYDANGNLLDPVTGAPLAIGADGNPINAAAGLYYDSAGNLINPATGMAVSWNENGEWVETPVATDAVSAAPQDLAADEAVEEVYTTPWLAPPPSGPPPGYQNWSPPNTVYVPETGHSVDGVFLDAWREWGGTTAWGNPITAELTEDGVIVQYYDYGKFEYHPADPEGRVVHFGDLGRQTQPFMVRRASGSGSAEANEAALAARAWVPAASTVARPDSLAWQYAPDTGHGVAGSFKDLWDETGGASYLGDPLTEPYKVDGITYQVFERGKIAQATGESPQLMPIGKLTVERLGLETAPTAQGDLPTYSEDLFTPPPITAVDGSLADPNGERWVMINLTLQYLWAYQGDTVLWQGYISSGRAGFQTPPGEFHVLSKLPSQTMEGVLGGEYYNVPDVPDVMYFTEGGHALHGTYWHNNFGTPMSHGCINLPMDVADWMYQWAPMGMRVDITQ